MVKRLAQTADHPCMLNLDPKWSDDKKTHALIYQAGGEPLLRQWSRMMADAGRNWEEEELHEWHHGFRIVKALRIVARSDEEILSHVKYIPLELRPLILDGEFCSTRLIEEFWYLPQLKLKDGMPMPHFGAVKAYYNQNELALEVYLNRPDLRALLPSHLASLFEASLRLMQKENA